MPFSDQAVIVAVMRAAERAAAGVHHDMSRGMNGLATIASVAPWLGLLITVMGIVGSFSGCNGPSPFCLAAVADGLADALARAALGLLVGILSLCCYRYLSFQLEDLDIEIRNMALELANVLSARLRRNHEPHAF
jgi:biopolymer transport protein ExbB/TolQ